MPLVYTFLNALGLDSTLSFSLDGYQVFFCKKTRGNSNSNHTKFENDILSDPGYSTKKPMECRD